MIMALSVAFLLFPPPQVRRGPVAVGALDGGAAVLRDLGEQHLDDRGRGVVTVDEDGEPARTLR
jgi:hypothetical protein